MKAQDLLTKAIRAAASAKVLLDIAKTHSGLISAFSLHLVKAGRVSVELGKALNKVEELRLVADYKGDPVDKEHAAWAVSQARTFVQAMQTTFMPKAPKKSSNGPEPF